MPSLAPLERRPEFADILKENVSYSRGTPGDSADRLNGWFDQLMVQSGLGLSPAVLLLLTILSTIAFGGTAFVIQENMLSTALAALVGFLLPVCTVMVLRSRRQTTILKQLPGMIGELARAARTGRSLEQCLDLVAHDTPAPLGNELKLCAGRMAMGLDPASALHDLPSRTGIQTLNVLVTALVVHHRTGGDLVRVLDRLAHTIRDRISFLGRLRAQTAASRATAILMIAVPVLILCFFIFRDPTYLTRLMQSSWGRTATAFAIVLQIAGSILVLRILKNTSRS